MRELSASCSDTLANIIDTSGVQRILEELVEMPENDAKLAIYMGSDQPVRTEEVQREKDFWIPKLRDLLSQHRAAAQGRGYQTNLTGNES